MVTISALINARTTSSRLPRKLVLPFSNSTLIDIALKKLNGLDFFDNLYFGAAEDELIDKALPLRNIQILRRDPAAIKPGYNSHSVVFAHYKLVQSDYIMWINPCHPLLSYSTLRTAVQRVKESQHNSYTSVVPTTDWIFTDSGTPVTNTSSTTLSSGHSESYYKVAHAFHVIRKEFFLQNYQYWSLGLNDPSLITIPEEENFDVNTPLEFSIAESAYRLFKHQQ